MIKKQVVFFIFLYYLLYNSGPASTIRETDNEKKQLHLVKYDPKFFLKKLYWSGDNAGIIFYLIENRKIYFILLYEIFSNKTIFYFFSWIGRREVTVI